ncbi:hypothetical protein AM1_C0313 (plasmid) [Acaryochloris marina MBIC11017]|uniref:Uncharacterized protein n=1 Tax=Acaryochloris marina (strain MBIC 11017) TaxID=329726 RepID=A8ZN42_ACAM1|nr:hypothetical protein AM1_C0313 [Acaryochloris marina MBIC11017]
MGGEGGAVDWVARLGDIPPIFQKRKPRTGAAGVLGSNRRSSDKPNR